MVWSIEWRRAQTQLLLCLTVGSAVRRPKRGGDLVLPACVVWSSPASVRGGVSSQQNCSPRAPAGVPCASAAADSALLVARRSVAAVVSVSGVVVVRGAR